MTYIEAYYQFLLKNPDKEIIPGSYSLYSIEGVDNYTTLSEVKSTEIKYEIIL